MKTKSLLTLMLVPLMIGCANSGENTSSESTETTITDGQGRTVTYDKAKLSRVVCIGAGALRYYSYIGDISKLVGVEKIDTPETTVGVGKALRPYYEANKETFKDLTIIGEGGPAAQTADVEKLAAARPDIIVSFLSEEKNDNLQSAINVPVIGLNQGPDGVFDATTLNSFRVLGEVFNRTERYNELNNYITTCKMDFDSLTKTEDTYYFGGIGNWGQTSMLGTMLNFPVIKYAKVKSALEDLEIRDKDGNIVTKGQVSIDREKLVEANPDHIFMDTAGLNGFISDYTENKTTYDALKAFQNGETYQVMPYNAYYSNLEIQLMSTYYVASIAHEGFTINLETKMNEITNKFLGKDMYNDIKAHKYGLGGYKKVDLKAAEPIQ